MSRTASQASQGEEAAVEAKAYKLGAEEAYLQPIMKALDTEGADAAYNKYLELRSQHSASPSYYLYVAQSLNATGKVQCADGASSSSSSS